MDVIIVCHTEFGFVRERKVVFDKRAREGVTTGVTNLARLADKYGAKVTFAVMPEVVEHFPAEVLKNHEVGLHTHPGWERFVVKGCEYYVGDTYLREHCQQSSDSTVLKDYPFSEQLDMIKAGKERVREVLGVDTTTHVAGRWSINNDTAKALVDAGFTRDCSATPGKKAAHYDWSRLPRICMPYNLSPGDYQQSGEMHLMEIPISQTLLNINLNPEDASAVGVRWLMACLKEYLKQGVPLLHICLHSPCMTDQYFVGALQKMLTAFPPTEISYKKASEIEKYDRIKTGNQYALYLPCVNATIAKSMIGASQSKILGALK